jgi:transcriptional regulator with XRE-family HTH domain
MHPIVARVKNLVTSARNGHRYKVESSILEFTEQIVARMEQKDISPKSLAERMGVKPSYVSKILRGTSNFTLDSMIKICSAVDAEYCPHVRPMEVTAVWEAFEAVSPVVSVEIHAANTMESARPEKYLVNAEASGVTCIESASDRSSPSHNAEFPSAA